MAGYLGAVTVGMDVTSVDVEGDITSTDTSPEVTLQNTTEEDTDGGRESKITFKGEQSGGELSTLAQIQASHDGTADDEKGDLIFSTNDGSDGNTPTERMRIDGSGNVGIGTIAPSSKLHIDDADDAASGFRMNNTAGESVQFYYASSSADADFIVNRTGSGAADIGLTHEGNVYFTSGNVGIGTSSPTDLLTLNATTPALDFLSSGTGKATILSGSGGALAFYTGGVFSGSGSERMRIDSSGNVLVGTTTTDTATTPGVTFQPDGQIFAGASGQQVATFSRQTSDGEIVRFRKGATTVGSISKNGSNEFAYISSLTFLNLFTNGNSNGLTYRDDATQKAFRPFTTRDNSIDLGASNARFDDVYATNGTIQTSDQNEKQQIASLTDAEMTAAKAISKLFKTFKWNDAVTEKGDAARTHTGVIAQQVETAMTDAGLNAGDYAFFISTTWWETYTDVAAVEAVDEVLDEDGNVITEAVEAQEAYTRTDTYDTAEEAPEGATERNRKGIRYPQLLSFIGAATEQRLASIESRLDALESA